ncbi:hypothetical protein [Methylobacterium iners]|uniref:Uncharacterized protein n=1 Tax=Methylobacterium iners TaxID=418707 RepID=A0ABQ4RQ93_9HYPH|nr:hypothetical protein [Methylobacterium iners]GJD92919.1 hypothetical protein OCOJLMKI_0102 [Methylobacterium iners]
MADVVYSQSKIITPGTPVVPGTGIGIAGGSAAGIVMLKMANGGKYAVKADTSHAQIDGLAVVDVIAAETTAVGAIVSVLS